MDTYGTAEAGQVAWQCRARDLYHVNHEAVVVEVLDEDGHPCPPGVLGEIVLTTLWNPLMPFLRYRQGDAAVWAPRPCRCGSAVPALERIEGRVLDWVVDDSGRRIAPQRLWLSVCVGAEHLTSVARYRVRQDERGAVTVELVLGEGSLDLDLVRSAYEALLGPGVPVVVETVDDLPNDASGKFRAITSAHAGAR
jgi:phenylacetate-CoA ligase